MLSRSMALKTYIIMEKGLIDTRLASVTKLGKELKKLERELSVSPTKEQKREVMIKMIATGKTMKYAAGRLSAAIALSIESSEMIEKNLY